MVLLSKKTYRQVVKKLDHYRKQHERDRKEHPDLTPCSWGGSIKSMIESTIRENKERVHKGQADRVLDYLVEKGLLVRYLGDVAFPQAEPLPTVAEVEAEANRLIREAGL